MKYYYFLLLTFIFGVNGFAQSTIIKNDTIVVGYNIDPPFCYEENGNLEGISIWLWDKISDKFQDHHIVYQKFELDDLLYNLSNGNVDVVISPLTITSKRNEFIDFSVPYFISNSNGMIKAESGFQKFINIVRSFFSWNFLKVIGFLMLLLAIFGFLVWFFERKKNHEEFDKSINGIWNGIWWSAVTMTTVGYGDKSPKTIGGRIIALIWMFMGIILISGITAGITSSLTVRKLNYSNTDVSVFKRIEIGTIHESATEFWLKNHFYTNTKSYHSLEEMLNAIKNDEIHVVAYDEPLLKYIVSQDKEENFEILQLNFNQSMYAMGFSKSLNESKQDAISTEILEIIEGNDWKLLLTEYNLYK